jgi:hypothetical protein
MQIIYCLASILQQETIPGEILQNDFVITVLGSNIFTGIIVGIITHILTKKATVKENNRLYKRDIKVQVYHEILSSSNHLQNHSFITNSKKFYKGDILLKGDENNYPISINKMELEKIKNISTYKFSEKTSVIRVINNSDINICVYKLYDTSNNHIETKIDLFPKEEICMFISHSVHPIGITIDNHSEYLTFDLNNSGGFVPYKITPKSKFSKKR